MIETYERFDFLAETAKDQYIYDENGDPMDMFRVSTTGNPNPEAFVPIIEQKKANKFSFKKD